MPDTPQPFDKKEGLFKDGDFTDAQRKVWESIAEGMPSTEAVFDPDGPILKRWMDHLYKRFATFMVWNIDHQDEDSGSSGDISDRDGSIVEIEDLSEHFEVIDFGLSLVMHPKDLFSHERADGHARQSVEALMHYIHEKKKWSRIELGGHQDLMKTAYRISDQLNEKTPQRPLMVFG